MKINTFADAFAALMQHEGGYSNNPNDPGGETMWGVSARVARASGYSGAMRELPLETAQAICKNLYWNPLRLDELPAPLAFHILDAHYNGGHAVQWMQQAAGLAADGVLRDELITAVRALGEEREDEFILRFSALRLNYLTCCKAWPTFSKGWARRIAKNLTLTSSATG